jgi:hypothetical protein
MLFSCGVAAVQTWERRHQQRVIVIVTGHTTADLFLARQCLTVCFSCQALPAG